MEVSILSDTNNAVANRREVAFSVIQESSTVSKEEIKKEVCKRLNLSPEATIVVEVKQEFGVKRSSGMLHSYKSKEDLERMEPKYLLARLTKKTKKESGEAPKEEKRAEAAPEAKKEHKEKKEEAKEEKKEAKEEHKEHKEKKEEKKE